MNEATEDETAFDEYMNRTIDQIPRFHPYSPPKDYRMWHDQVKGLLFMLGIASGFTPVAEYPVPSVKTREGTGRIDMVWLHFCPNCGRIPMAAFEIDSSIKRNSVKKLEAIECPYKFEIGVGKSATRRTDIEPILDGTGIRFLVMRPTGDQRVSIESRIKIILALAEEHIVDESSEGTNQQRIEDFIRQSQPGKN